MQSIKEPAYAAGSFVFIIIYFRVPAPPGQEG